MKPPKRPPTPKKTMSTVAATNDDDRRDADQTTTRLIARDEANRVIVQHLTLCPLAQEDVASRLRDIEKNFNRSIGFMLGSGILGGAAGSLLTHILK